MLARLAAVIWFVIRSLVAAFLGIFGCWPRGDISREHNRAPADEQNIENEHIQEIIDDSRVAPMVQAVNYADAWAVDDEYVGNMNSCFSIDAAEYLAPNRPKPGPCKHVRAPLKQGLLAKSPGDNGYSDEEPDASDADLDRVLGKLGPRYDFGDNGKFITEEGSGYYRRTLHYDRDSQQSLEKAVDADLEATSRFQRVAKVARVMCEPTTDAIKRRECWAKDWTAYMAHKTFRCVRKVPLYDESPRIEALRLRRRLECKLHANKMAREIDKNINILRAFDKTLLPEHIWAFLTTNPDSIKDGRIRKPTFPIKKTSIKNDRIEVGLGLIVTYIRPGLDWFADPQKSELIALGIDSNCCGWVAGYLTINGCSIKDTAMVEPYWDCDKTLLGASEYCSIRRQAIYQLNKLLIAQKSEELPNKGNICLTVYEYDAIRWVIIEYPLTKKKFADALTAVIRIRRAQKKHGAGAMADLKIERDIPEEKSVPKLDHSRKTTSYNISVDYISSAYCISMDGAVNELNVPDSLISDVNGLIDVASKKSCVNISKVIRNNDHKKAEHDVCGNAETGCDVDTNCHIGYADTKQDIPGPPINEMVATSVCAMSNTVSIS